MASLQNFDTEIEKTKTMVNEMRTKIDQSSVVLDKFAKADAKIGASDFDIENARIDDVLRQQKVMEGNIAELIIGLEDATNIFGTEFESMKGYSGWEKFVGVFSKDKMQRLRSDRVRNMSLAGNLQELLTKSDRIVGILKEQKVVLDERYKTSENSLATVIDAARRPSPTSKPRRNASRSSTRCCSTSKTALQPRRIRARVPDSRANVPSLQPNIMSARPRNRSFSPKARR